MKPHFFLICLIVLLTLLSCREAVFEGTPNDGHWKASAKFCDFWIDITKDNRFIVSGFDYPCEMRCGIYEAYGHFEAFTLDTEFTTKDHYNQNPPPPSDPVVDFPISGPEFTAGPFWLAISVEHTGRLPVAQLSLDIRFTSATTLSGKYYYQGSKPSSTTLVQPVCQGKFTAEWVNP